MTFGIKKTNVMSLDAIAPPLINIDNMTLDGADQLTQACVDSTIRRNDMSLHVVINMRITKVAAVMFRLNKIRNSNTDLTENIKLCVYQTFHFMHRMADGRIPKCVLYGELGQAPLAVHICDRKTPANMV